LGPLVSAKILWLEKEVIVKSKPASTTNIGMVNDFLVSIKILKITYYIYTSKKFKIHLHNDKEYQSHV
jgi:hypothetical protein